MESLRESNTDQLVQIAGQGAPAGVLVVAKTEEIDIPKHYTQSVSQPVSSLYFYGNVLFARYFSDKHFRVI